MRLMQKPMQLQNASTQANATKATNASTNEYKSKCNATYAKTDATTKCKCEGKCNENYKCKLLI